MRCALQSGALHGMRLLTKLTKLRFVPALYAKHSFLQGFTDYRFVPALYAKQSKATYQLCKEVRTLRTKLRNAEQRTSFARIGEICTHVQVCKLCSRVVLLQSKV